MALLGIGLPVFNGERYIRDAIEGLLAQSFSDYQLLICDNASTDGTREICLEYQRSDQRVLYRRNETNVGAAANFNLAFQLTTGRYFKWAADDDICGPDFLSACVNALEADQQAVLAMPPVRVIGVDGQVLFDYDPRLRRSGSSRPSQRFRELIDMDHWCTDIFGLMRRDVLARTPVIGSFLGSDRNVLAELALYGRFCRTTDGVFLSREHPARSVRAFQSEAVRAAWFDPNLRQSRTQLRYVRRLLEYVRSLKRVPLRFRDRVACYGEIALWVRHYARPMVTEWWAAKVLRRAL